MDAERGREVFRASTPFSNQPEVNGIKFTDLRAEYSGAYPERDMAGIDTIVLHHTGNAFDSDPAGIDAYHRGLGYPGIGYHFVVMQDRSVYYVGDVATTRAHIYGRNPSTIGIVLSGDFTHEPPSERQLQGAEVAIVVAMRAMGKALPILGHREAALNISPTSCPGDTYKQWLPRLKAVRV